MVSNITKNSQKVDKMIMRRFLTVAILTASVGLFSACSTTKQARSVKTSGFLGDYYSMLREGGKDEALLLYRNQNANIADYSKILLEPVQM